MHLKKFLLFGLMAAVLPAVAEEAADRKTATSLKYVTHELDTRQNKFTAEQNKAMEYTNAAGDVQKRAVTSDLDNGGTDSLPMVGGVNTKLATKQDDIAPINDHTAVTYTGTAGKIGAKGIYQTSESYVEQSNNLIDAKTFNAALKRGLDSEFLCSEYKPGTDLCWVWAIHNNGPKNLYDPATNPIEQGNINSSNGQPIDNLGEKRVRTGFINVEPNTQYTISSGGLSYIFVYQYGSDGTYVGNSVSVSWHVSPSTFTTSPATGKIRIILANGQNPDTSTSITPSDLLWLQVEAGSTATPYQDVPYTTLVPAGYTPVEWIGSSGSQRINPNVTGNARWVITAQANQVKGSSQSLIASTPQASGGSWYGEFTTTGHWDVVSGGTNILPTTKTTADLSFDSTGVNGTIGNIPVSRNVAVTQANWSLFGTTSGSYMFAGKVFYAKVYQNGALVRNFIPAKQGTTVGMYDTVSGEFFENVGEGDFTAGPDISNIVYIPQNQ